MKMKKGSYHSGLNKSATSGFLGFPNDVQLTEYKCKRGDQWLGQVAINLYMFYPVKLTRFIA